MLTTPPGVVIYPQNPRGNNHLHITTRHTLTYSRTDKPTGSLQIQNRDRFLCNNKLFYYVNQNLDWKKKGTVECKLVRLLI